MTNPYEILGVKSDAGKSEIDAAYNRLITEYKNSGSSDKIQELTTAYNQAVNQYNESIVLGNTVSQTINPYYAPSDSVNINVHKVSDKSNNYCSSENNTDDKKSECQNSENVNVYTNDVFGSVRQFIDMERYIEAENLLNSINYKDTALWHYLYGKMCYGRGWMNQAAIHFQRAYTLEPSNQQYREENMRINNMKLNSSKVPKAVIAGGIAVCALRICYYTSPILINFCDDL